MPRKLLLLSTTALRLLVSSSFSVVSQRKLISFPMLFKAKFTSLQARISSGRGLDRDVRTASPQLGGMSLYIKSASDSISPGDCPFAHYVRMVLEQLQLEYQVMPTAPEDKPFWLIEYYDGNMPCLRHRSEAYVDSDVIVQYLDYFFGKDVMLGVGSKEERDEASRAAEVFGSVARYFKCVVDVDGSERDGEYLLDLRVALGALERHLLWKGRSGPFLVGDGTTIAALDCSLAPKIYHLEIGLRTFKTTDNGGTPPIDFSVEFPAIYGYMENIKEMEIWKNTVYPEDAVTWGWENARKN